VRADASIELISGAAHETARAGELLGALLAPGDVVALEGEMGAGKTIFSKGVAAGLGLEPRAVRSATFTLLERYEGGRVPLVHVDAYRLTRADDLVALGLEEVLDPAAVLVIEWAPRVIAALPEERLEVALAHEDEPESGLGHETEGTSGRRRLRALGRGGRGRMLLEQWRSTLEAQGFGTGG